MFAGPAYPASRGFTACLVYVALLLDNVLLTVIVPILPDYLAELGAADDGTMAAAIGQMVPHAFVDTTVSLHYVPPSAVRLADENGAIGVLLATKALVQLLVTPLVGNFAQRLGYRLPIVMGTACLLFASFVFAIGTTYAVLLMARALQGVASSCIGVCGMSLIAQLYPEEERRSRVMGILLGSVALGVLIGYPFGGIVYDLAGKATPFWILAGLLAACLVLQLSSMDLCGELHAELAADPTSSTISSTEYARCLQLLDNRTVRLVIVAIWLSTSAMAILEPCLPIWLMANLHPKRWQVGTVFVPDSVGYFVGTNFFGAAALRAGQLRIAVGCLLMVGISCFVIPSTATVLGLLVPHFTLGLGIGILDAALVPLLATIVDQGFCDSVGEDHTPNQNGSNADSDGGIANYGVVYAIQQMAVSLAYAMAPLLGGEIAQYVSFGWLMAAVGCANVGYALLLMVLLVRRSNDRLDVADVECNMMLEFGDVAAKRDYRRFYDDSME